MWSPWARPWASNSSPKECWWWGCLTSPPVSYTHLAALNRARQAAVNPPAPGKVEKAFGPTLFREGDRVMQVKNNYDVLWASADGKEVGMGIFNGDIGQITAIDPSSGLVTVDFEGHLAQ